MAEPSSHLHLDTTGQSCPLPIIRLAMASRGQPPGTELEITGNDPVFERSVRDFCATHGHTVLAVVPGERLRVTVRLRLGGGAA